VTEPAVPRRWSNPDPAPADPTPPGAVADGQPGAPGAYAGPVGYGHPPGPRLTRISGLGTALLVLGGVWTALQVLTALAAKPAQRRYAEAAALGQDPADVLTAYDLVSVPGIVVILAVWAVGSLWLGGAYDNARALAAHQLRRRKVWVWLGWWVPIVSLWFPKTIVDDVWLVTYGRGPLARLKDTGLWWGLWVIFNVVSNGLGRLGVRDPGVSDTVVILEWVSAVVMVAAFFAWVPIVRGLSAAQDELVRSRSRPA